MKKLVIVENDEYANYVLEDTNKKKYEMNINFMGVEKPKVGTVIYIDESVIKEHVALNYGKIKDDVTDEKELMIVLYGDSKLYLQRFYG